MSGSAFKYLSVYPQATLRHGPREVLARTMITAELLARDRGVWLSFATPEEAVAVNAANRATWLPLISIFDCRFSALDRHNSFFILGRDREGDVVACQAGRLLDWPASTFAAEAESLRLFYADPETMKLPGESCRVSALAAHGTSGRMVFSGGAWYRPDYRGRGLVELLPRISRAYARGAWDTRATVTMMAEANVAKGVFPRNGYRNLEWEVELSNSRMGTIRFAYLWSKSAEMEDDLRQFLLGIDERTLLDRIGTDTQDAA